MNTDVNTIIEEIHNAREKLKERYSGDITAYSKNALAHCKEMGFKFVTLASISIAQRDASRDAQNYAPRDF